MLERQIPPRRMPPDLIIIVPAWKLRVVDENGQPYIGKQVRQAWKHYSLDMNTGENMEDQITDKNGYVLFPERKIRASLLSRIILSVYSAAMTLAHGSYGIRADVSAVGPQGYKSVEYVPNQTPPEQLVLNSQK